MEVVASLSEGRRAVAQCDFFTYKSVLVIFEPPCILLSHKEDIFIINNPSLYFSVVFKRLTTV